LAIAASRSKATASLRNSAGARCARSDVLTKYSVVRLEHSERQPPR
jgi:hypothetical protein